jgi:archaellum component FlaC
MAGTNDVRSLKFNAATMAAIVLAACGVVAAQYAQLSKVRSEQSDQVSSLRVELIAQRSDVRDILTRMESGAKIVELQAEAAKTSSNATKDDINEIKRRLEALTTNYQQLRELVMATKR